MTIRRLIFAVPVACALATMATLVSAESIEVNYEYAQKPQVDFSNMPKGPLKIAAFTDARGVGPTTLTDDLESEKPVADIVNDALTQAFTAGGAALVDDGEKLTLEGEVTEVQVTDNNGAVEATIRTRATLKRGAQSAYSTVIFGRAEAATADEAIRLSLDRLVNSLILDDYFLMEVL